MLRRDFEIRGARPEHNGDTVIFRASMELVR